MTEIRFVPIPDHAHTTAAGRGRYQSYLVPLREAQAQGKAVVICEVSSREDALLRRRALQLAMRKLKVEVRTQVALTATEGGLWALIAWIDQSAPAPS